MLRYISIIVTRRMGTEECKCCKENSDLLAETVIVAIKCITYNEDFKLLCVNKTTKLCSKLLVSVIEDTKTSLQTFKNKLVFSYKT